MPPVLQQSLGYGRDAPVVGIGQGTPGFEVAADLVDDRRRVVAAGGAFLGIRYRDLQSDRTEINTIDVREIDLIFLRNDPSQDAPPPPFFFFFFFCGRARCARRQRSGWAGPRSKQALLPGLSRAVRPATLISKSIEEIRAFIEQQPKGAIVKPLQGSGGKNVFKINSPKDANLNQIFEAVSGEGYLIAQGYLPEAKAGDIRLFVMNGKPLERDGKYAAFRRVPAKGEVRSNIHVAGTAEKVEVTDKMLSARRDGPTKTGPGRDVLVGLDIVGDKILEINVFTPGGLSSMSEMYKTNFAESVIVSLENKLSIRAGLFDLGVQIESSRRYDFRASAIPCAHTELQLRGAVSGYGMGIFQARL